MKIFEHLIKTSEIIGISPLYAQSDKDATMRTLYKSFKYMFHVYTRQQSIEITSETFYPGDTSDLDKASATGKKIIDWKDQYFGYRSEIELLIDIVVK